MRFFYRERQKSLEADPPSKLESELREEIRFYLDMRTQEFMGEGLDVEQARAKAEAVFGGSGEIVAECLATSRMGRRGKGMAVMRTIGQDIRHALRFARKSPLFTAVAVLTLSLGIGANTAIFSVVNSVLLKSLPFPDSRGLVTLSTAWDGRPKDERGDMAPPDVSDILAGSPSIASLVGYQPLTVTLTGVGDPELISATRLSEGLLEVFRLRPRIGRDIRADEHGYGAPPIAVISYRFWQDYFGMAEDVEGRQIELGGRAHEIVGVAPEGFGFPGRTAVWIPHRFNSPEGLSRASHTWRTIGRLRDTAPLRSAQSDVDAIASALSSAYPESNTGKSFFVESLHDSVVNQARTELWLLLGTVGVVLLIACANVTNLLLIRASERAGEVAIRAALGASRFRIGTQILFETGLLAVTGGVVGLVMALGGVELFRLASAGAIPRAEEIAVDGIVLAFTVGLVVVVTLAAGLSPLFHLTRVTLSSNLTCTGRGADVSRMGNRSRRLLLGFEVALSVVLLAGAGLLLRTFQELHSVELGFDVREVVRFSLARGGELEDIRTFYRTLEENVASLPGVESVGSVYGAPLGPGHTTAVVRSVDRPAPEAGRETYAGIRAVSPDYLTTARIPLIRGRTLTSADDVSPSSVAVVNESFVRENFPGEEPLGKRVRILTDQGYGSPTWTIVGVVGDIRSESLRQEPIAEIYVPHGHFGPGFLTVTVRGTGGVEDLIPAIRAEILALDPRMPLRTVETLSDAIRREVAPTRFFMTIGILFAGLALLLSAVGMYGVLGYLVSQRQREIGVRVALGARGDRIVWMVVVEGLRIVLIGAVAGLAVALWSGRLLSALLYSVEPWDLRTLGLVLVVLFLAAFSAFMIPAWRATHVDPIEALRAE
jgi:predicted permease